MMSPLFLSKRRRTSCSCRQAGLLAPGSAAARCARVPPSPVRAPSGFWDELPGYSGGTAPEFDRLPSRPLWGATAARLAIALARLRRSPRLVKRGVFGQGSFVLRTCDDERSEISRCERVAVVHGRTACRP